MSARRKRISRKLEDLPSLFDVLYPEAAAETPAASEKAAPAPVDTPDIAPEALKRPESLRYITMGSGSSGNCAYLGNERGGILIDGGVDNNIVTKVLEDNGIDLRSIAGIILTHDHNDHVRFAYSLLRRNQSWRLFCTPRALNGLLRRHNISRRIRDYHTPIFKEFEFEAGGFAITPFEVSHDGTDNVGFFITAGNHNFVIATDMGMVTDRAMHYLGRANYIQLESNYDLEMLQHGRYPEYLKARIIGNRGHLDNKVSADLVRQLLQTENPSLTHVFLCHLSADNNTPELALSTMRNTLGAAGIEMGDSSGSPQARQCPVQVAVLPRYDASPLYIFRK